MRILCVFQIFSRDIKFCKESGSCYHSGCYRLGSLFKRAVIMEKLYFDFVGLQQNL